MEDKTRYKYAVVRVKESAVVDFFGLIAANGYSDVSFVSNLSQAITRPDPNDDATDTPSSNKDDRVADSEDRCSLAGTPQSPPTEELKLNSSINNQLAMMVKEQSPVFNGSDVSVDLAAAASSELISNLFATHAIPFNTKDWSSSQNDVGPIRAGSKQNTPLQFQTRMKGWQREYIKDIINNGHYPTEEELRDIEQKCDLSRKQVLRFIAKRLVNPNRKPRADWRSDRAADAAANGSLLVKEEPGNFEHALPSV